MGVESLAIISLTLIEINGTMPSPDRIALKLMPEPNDQTKIMDLTAPITRDKLDTILQELHRQLKELYGSRLVKLILYGSQARGDAEPGSDIDVMVVLEGSVVPGKEIARTGEIVASLSLEHDEVISRIFVSAEQFIEKSSSLLLNVYEDGVVLDEF